MGAIIDLWHLHRDRILQGGGILLCVLAVALVLADGIGTERDGYETGKLLGTATRNVVLAVIVATLGVYAVRRYYWHEDGASWKQITPEASAIAGVLAVILAVALGAPQTDAEEDREAVFASIDDCGKESPAVAGNLPQNSAELSSAEIQKANPGLASAPPPLRDAARMYVWRSRGVPFVLSTFPIPADRMGDQSVLAEYFEGFGETIPPAQRARAGITNEPIAARPAYQVAFRGSSARFVAVLDGCHVVTLQANAVGTSAVMSRLLDGVPESS